MEETKDNLPTQSDFDKARAELMKRLPVERIKKIEKYRNFNMAQYLKLIDKLEKLAILLLESYIFEVSNETQ